MRRTIRTVGAATPEPVIRRRSTPDPGWVVAGFLRFRWFALVLAAVALSLTGPAAAQDPDHLKCYKVRDPLLLSGTVDLSSPQLGDEPGCKIGRATPALFCVPATKTVVEVKDRATGQPIAPLPVTGPDPGDRLCYKI